MEQCMQLSANQKYSKRDGTIECAVFFDYCPVLPGRLSEPAPSSQFLGTRLLVTCENGSGSIFSAFHKSRVFRGACIKSEQNKENNANGSFRVSNSAYISVCIIIEKTLPFEKAEYTNILLTQIMSCCLISKGKKVTKLSAKVHV
jgi:hypothetical protein